jgi:hypothetical protein
MPAIKREAESSEYVLVSERGSPFTTAEFAKLIRAKSWVTSQNQLTGNGAL